MGAVRLEEWGEEGGRRAWACRGLAIDEDRDLDAGTGKPAYLEIRGVDVGFKMRVLVQAASMWPRRVHTL